MAQWNDTDQPIAYLITFRTYRPLTQAVLTSTPSADARGYDMSAMCYNFKT